MNLILGQDQTGTEHQNKFNFEQLRIFIFHYSLKMFTSSQKVFSNPNWLS